MTEPYPARSAGDFRETPPDSKDAGGVSLLAAVAHAISDVVSSRDDLGHVHFMIILDAVFAALRSAPVPQRDGANPARYWEMMYTDLLKRADAGEFSRHVPQRDAEPVQDTYLVGGSDLKAMSGSVESDRIIQLHFRRKATDEDRKWLLEAINAKIAAARGSP